MSGRLCYVLPKYDPASDEHFAHIFDFLEVLAARVDLYLIIEKCTGRPTIKGVKYLYVQRSRFPLMRLAELLVVLFRIRLIGCSKFYVHYSYYGAALAPIVCGLCGGQVYYWNCGLAAQFFVPWRLVRENLRHKFRAELPLRLALKVADHLVTGTPSMADYYAANFGMDRARILVIPNEINLKRFRASPARRTEVKRKLGYEEKEKVIFFVHRLSERKGAHHLIPLAERIAKTDPWVRWLVAGGGPYESTLRTDVKAKGLESIVRLLGWVPNSSLPGYYAVAALFVMPSEEEGFPRVLLEAMAMGVPFVATDVGGVRDILTEEQRKFLVVRGDMEGMAGKITALLEDEGQRERLREEGMKRVQEFTTEKVIESILREIVAA